MNKEEKQLLLKDLCARVIYQPKVYVEGDWVEDEIDSYNTTLTLEKLVDYKNNNYILKPYLRPMSSMTEEEKYTYRHMLGATLNSEGESILFVYVEDFPTVMDWLNAHHFDYNGLIEKGLALEAPENMYKN